MPKLPSILAFDYFRHTYVGAAVTIVQGALALASLTLITVIALGVL